MKRRIEEPVKTAETSGVYPPSPLSPPPTRVVPRTIASVTQPGYVQPLKPAELRSVTGFPSFTATMPAVAPTSVKPVTSSGLQGGAQALSSIHSLSTHPPMRHKIHGGSMTPPVSNTTSAAQQQQIQRLKVEDALSYLDMVKFKFGDQPQVYNDFLDIMKEFKSQSIDTPGVIDRVSSLFNGHPELIVGFNTFLPPGYKIEVKTNEQGYSFQVQVSMPSPSASTTTMVPAAPAVHHTSHLPSTVIPVTTTVVTKPLVLTTASTLVSQAQAAAVVAPPVVPVPATTPPHFPVAPIITQVQAHQAVSQALSHVDNPPAPTPQSQPVEFNHAINYVNKIKNRFQGQPDKYKRFLEILHTYQKEQRNLKEGSGPVGASSGTKQLTEAEVYSQVAKLFENQEDLLAEFGQFLPDATNHQAQLARRIEEPPVMNRKPAVGVKMGVAPVASPAPSPVLPPQPTAPKLSLATAPPAPTPAPAQAGPPPPMPESGSSQSLKRSPSLTLHPSPSTSAHLGPPPAKKHKLSTSFKDVSLAEAAKYGSLNEFAFFDKVRRTLRSQEVYDNFLRCINLYTQDVLSNVELQHLVSPFLSRTPDLLRWLNEFMGLADGPPVHLAPGVNSPPPPHSAPIPGPGTADGLLNNGHRDRPGSDHSEIGLSSVSGTKASEINFSSCKRLGASYCALPKNHQQEKCSGRTALCKEVLNDTWVSFPTWSEESTFVTSRKTQYEEYIYRCEDERFELDVVLEVNAATIKSLEGVHKTLCRLSTEEVSKFRLDDTLGGSSTTIHQRALHRVYGDKAPDIIDGLKKNPVTAVPIVLRRLRAKEAEWRDAQEGFNKIWREQNEKYYLKSLDHQGINFKQNDMKALRSKSLFNEIETFFDERHEQSEAGMSVSAGPHMVLHYRDKSVLDDASNLLIHHVKRQTSIHKEDKAKVKRLLRVLLPDLFHHPRQELSEDERDEEKKSAPGSPSGSEGTGNSKSKGDEKNKDDGEEDVKLPIHVMSNHPDEKYTLFFGNGHWYLFLRLHQILCERLTHIYTQANKVAQEENSHRKLRSEMASAALRLKPKSEYLVDVEVEDYYVAFLDMVKNVLDGNMEANAYEDTLREMFGIHAYLAFTLDKVVAYAVRQLQHLVTDEGCIECTELYYQFHKRGGAGGPVSTAVTRLNQEAAYQRKAELALADENCFKIFIYKMDCRLTIELLDSEENENEAASREAEKWSAYVDRFSKSASKEKDDGLDGEEDGDDPDADVKQERRRRKKAIYLPRNVRLWHRRVGHSRSNIPKMDSCDDTECKFTLNSYKMVFVMDRESYLYKRSALFKAKNSHKRMSQQMSEKFHKWHEDWASTHLTQQQTEFADRWMRGDLPDYHPEPTVTLTDNPTDKPPYHTYNRYRVVR